MVTDVLENSHLYEGLNERFKKSFAFLKETDFCAMENGKYEIEGDNIFAIVNQFETKDKRDCEAEAHKKHIDIQYIVSGTELFGYSPLTTQRPIVDYDETNDVAIYNDKVSYIQLKAGMFIIFYPTDLHQPEMRVLEPVTVKKVVIKVKI